MFLHMIWFYQEVNLASRNGKLIPRIRGSLNNIIKNETNLLIKN